MKQVKKSVLVVEIEQRKIRSLYKWISKITGVEACWVEGADEGTHPIWGFIKRVAHNLLAIHSRKLIAASMVGVGLLISPSAAIAQTSVNISSTLTGLPHGLVINGINNNDRVGSTLASGDINGDGIQDLIIGAANVDGNGTDSGEIYVVFGSSSFSSSINLSSLNGTNGFVLKGEGANDRVGFKGLSVGDINGDGIQDVVTGAEDADFSGKSNVGKVYVVYGKTTAFSSSMELSSLNGTSGFIINGAVAGETAGYTATTGNINGDGFDDVIFGTNYYSTGGGNVFVLFGGSNISSSVSTTSLNGTAGFVLNQADSYDGLGKAVASGDIDGDGNDDIIMGAYGGDPASGGGAGETYVLFGKTTAFASSIDVSNILNGSTGFVVNGIDAADGSGSTVSVGDINGDNKADILIGAESADPNGNASGETYVVFGKSSFASSINLSSLNGTSGFVLKGINGQDNAGESISSGDIDKDGNDDIIVGAARTNTGTDDEGQTYVVFGKTSAFASSIELSSLNGTDGFALNGIDANDYSGTSVATGDINGDGSVDIIISAERADPGEGDEGEVYVFTRPILNQAITGDEGFRTLSAPANGTIYDELLADLWTQGLTNGDTDSGTDNLYRWDGEAQAWVGISNLNTRILSAGQGFLMYVFSDDNGPGTAGDAGFPKNLTTLNLNQDDGETIDFSFGTVNAVSNVADASFVLVGNPYLFPIDWDELTKSNLSNTIYVYDDANSVFQSWNGSVGNVTNGEIATFQGFFIQGSGGSGSLTMEIADTVSTSVNLLKTVGAEPKALKVHAESGNFKVDAWLSFQEGGEVSKDDFDGLALAPLNATYLRLATVIDTEETLSINALPIDQEEEIVFPLDLSGVLEEVSAVLSFEGLDNFEGWNIFIRDKQADAEHTLEEGQTLELEIDKVSAKSIPAPGLPTPTVVKKKSASSRYEIVLQPEVSVSTEEGISNLPGHVQLEQNYPNPFNPNTKIAFGVPRAGLVRLEVFDLLGRKVSTLVNSRQPAGRYSVSFDASQLSSGLYLYRLQVGTTVLTRKMTLIK